MPGIFLWALKHDLAFIFLKGYVNDVIFLNKGVMICSINDFNFAL